MCVCLYNHNGLNNFDHVFGMFTLCCALQLPKEFAHDDNKVVL